MGLRKKELWDRIEMLEMELRMARACSNELREENSMLKKALSEIANLPGVRQDECCNIALGALDTNERPKLRGWPEPPKLRFKMLKTKRTKIGNAGWPVPLECFVMFFSTLWALAKRLISYLLLLDEAPYFRRVVYETVLWFSILGFLVGFFATWFLPKLLAGQPLW